MSIRLPAHAFERARNSQYRVEKAEDRHDERTNIFLMMSNRWGNDCWHYAFRIIELISNVMLNIIHRCRAFNTVHQFCYKIKVSQEQRQLSVSFVTLAILKWFLIRLGIISAALTPS